MITFGKDALELHDIAAVWCALEHPPDPADTEDDLPCMSPGWVAVRRKFDIERYVPLYVPDVLVLTMTGPENLQREC